MSLRFDAVFRRREKIRRLLQSPGACVRAIFRMRAYMYAVEIKSYVDEDVDMSRKDVLLSLYTPRLQAEEY
jgi:hypothetical protein